MNKLLFYILILLTGDQYQVLARPAQQRGHGGDSHCREQRHRSQQQALRVPRGVRGSWGPAGRVDRAGLSTRP